MFEPDRPNRWRLLAGGAVGLNLAAVLTIAATWIARPLVVSTFARDNDGSLFSKPVFLGLSVPILHLIFCVAAFVCTPIVCAIIQNKPAISSIANGQCLIVASLTGAVAGYFAISVLGNYYAELFWMYHD